MRQLLIARCVLYFKLLAMPTVTAATFLECHFRGSRCCRGNPGKACSRNHLLSVMSALEKSNWSGTTFSDSKSACS